MKAKIFSLILLTAILVSLTMVSALVINGGVNIDVGDVSHGTTITGSFEIENNEAADITVTSITNEGFTFTPDSFEIGRASCRERV